MGADDQAGDGGEADAVEEPRDELRRLAAGFRTNLALRQRSGLMGVAVARTRRRATAAVAATARPATVSPVASPPAGRIGSLDGPDLDDDAPAERPPGAAGLSLVREELGDCTRCKLSGGRKTLVYGVGNPEAHLVFVGEAPGADEDEQGEPFVGKAGQLLNKMIEAMGYARQDVYICNVVKCRPPQNRNPEPDEIAACEPFLKKQLGAIRPRMIVTLGKFAAQCLLRDDTPISRLRGNFRTYEGIQLMPTFHPAYLLRDPSKKKEAWEDLKAVLAALRRLGFSPPRPPAP
jgi:uracil-DNA glycosylase family 4